MSQTSKTIERPLSPHLQVYRLPLTAITSILHRATAIVLTLGTLLVTGWLVAAAMGEEYYNMLMDLAQTPLGTFILFGWSLALFYHMCSGIRHLIMDTGALFKQEHANATATLVFLVSIFLTCMTWYCVETYQSKTVANETDKNAKIEKSEKPAR